MKKTIVYIAIMAVLGLGAFYFFTQDDSVLFKEKEANFTIADTSIIGKIFLVEKNGESITVERGHSNDWVLDGKYPVMPVQIKNILFCLKKQSAQRPVSDRDYDRVIKMLSGTATKVEVYNRDGKRIRTFYVAGQGSNYQGSFMLNEGAETPYLVEIKGYDGYLSPYYTTDFHQWRSHNMFDIVADSIRSVEVDYPTEPMNSFIIDNSASPVKIQVHSNLANSYTTEKINQRRQKDYLNFFKNVNIEAYLNGTVDVDSTIKNAKLRCHFNVVQKNGKEAKLDVYWMDESDKYKSLKDQTSTDPGNRPMDVDRMYAVNHTTNDTIVIQSMTFEKFFRKSYEFFMTDAQIIQRQKQMQQPHDHHTPVPQNPNKETGINYL